MKTRSRLMVSMVAIGGLTALVCSVSATEPGAPAGAAGVRAYIDPNTGRPGVPPPDEVPDTPAVKRALGASQQPVEVPNPGPSGGFMLDTSDLAVAGVIATVDANGKAAVHCDDVAPADTQSVVPQE